MFTSIFLKLTDYPAFRRIIWKQVYELLAGKFKVKDWSFMNYGYAPSDNEAYLRLEQQDEINRYPIQLYHYLASKVNIEGLKILEVGSGRGGGANYIGRYFKPEIIIGLDIAVNAVELANKYYRSESVTFIQGSAEQLPFVDEEFDKVFTVNTIYFWTDPSLVLSEIKRVLKPTGEVIISIRPEAVMQYYPFVKYGFEMFNKEELTDLLTQNDLNVTDIIEREEPEQEIAGEKMSVETLIVCAEK